LEREVPTSTNGYLDFTPTEDWQEAAMCFFAVLFAGHPVDPRSHILGIYMVKYIGNIENMGIEWNIYIKGNMFF
jgi:hypothetical protein